MRTAYSACSYVVRLPGYVIAFLLAVLLATTTPVGTGAGVHQFDLLHPLFEHVHLVNGRVLTHEQMEQEFATAPQSAHAGPAFGAGTGSVAGDMGLGVSPMPPIDSIVAVASLGATHIVADAPPPPGRREAPPSPPPLH